MNVHDFIVDRFDKFLAPSACLVFETLLKLLPELCATTKTVLLTTKSGERIVVPEKEHFAVLGYSGPRGEERIIILLTSRGVGCCLLLQELI